MTTDHVVLLPVFDGSGKPPGQERVPARQLREGDFALIFSPGVAEGYAAGDVVAVDATMRAVRIVRRGNNLAVWVYAPRGRATNEDDARWLHGVVAPFGGRADGGTRVSVVATVPVAATIGRVGEAMDAAVAQRSDWAWSFGNVYSAEIPDERLDWCTNFP